MSSHRDTPPSIMLLSAVWPGRALLRAQLIESGLEVVATDSWADAREQMLRSGLPQLLVVDLQDLPEPASTLRELGSIMPHEHVLLLGTLATADADNQYPGFRVLQRPLSIRTITETVESMLKTLGHQ